MATFKFPSKTFLLGEYAILQGSNALLLGHGPHFTCSQEPAAALESPFHPDSPAGQWLKANPIEARIRFQDPHQGAGGFGGSGAEFLSAWSFDKQVPSVENPRAIFAWSAWEDSRAFPGSGADILVQAFGVNRLEPFFLEVDLVGRSLREVYPVKTHLAQLSLFHTGKKLATHEVKAPPNLPAEEMEDLVLHAANCLESGQVEAFARDVQQYGEKLASLGLVAPHTAAALKGMEARAEVLGAKGCGAMGSDVILVVHKGGDFTDWMQANSLAHVGTFPV